MPKQKVYMILGRVVWLLALGGLVFLLMTGMQTRQQETCSGILVNIGAVNGKVFIDEKEIKTILAAEMGGVMMKRELKNFNLRNMENRLRKEVWIEDAEVFFDNEGKLHAKIIERVPVARIFNIQGMSHYIDTAGTMLPLSFTDRADVPVFTNVPVLNKNNKSYFDSTIRSIINIAQVIDKDEFWKAQAAQIDVIGNGRYELYPAIGFHIVELGTAEKMEQKLNRLKVFYRDILSQRPLGEYARISVAYNQQVVAIRGDGTLPGIDPAKAIEMFSQLVDKNKVEVNALAIQSDKDNGRIMPEFDNSNKPAIEKEKKPAAPAPAPVVAPAVTDTNSLTPKPKAVLPAKTSLN